MLQNGVLPARGGTSLSGIFLPPWQRRGCAPGRDRRTSWCAPRDYRKARPYHRPDGRAANPVATGGSCEAVRPLHPCCTPPLHSPLTCTSLGHTLLGERPHPVAQMLLALAVMAATGKSAYQRSRGAVPMLQRGKECRGRG